MSDIRIESTAKGVRLSISSGSHSVDREMSLGEARHILLQLGEAIGKTAERAEKGRGIAHRHPFLEVIDPHFQIATTQDGTVMLALIAGPLPPIRLMFADDRAKEIADVFSQIVQTPRRVRVAPTQ